MDDQYRYAYALGFCRVEHKLVLSVLRAVYLPKEARCHVGTEVACGGVALSPLRTASPPINEPIYIYIIGGLCWDRSFKLACQRLCYFAFQTRVSLR